jgi:hypothetical protein
MGKVRIIEFLPPIVLRCIKYIYKNVRIVLNKQIKYHPFDQLPNELKTNLIIIDVGANIGDFAEMALKSYRNTKVICFEPVAETYNILVENLCRYDKKVEFHKVSLSKNEVGVINITTFHDAN